jgi:hypothetical protein
MAITYGGVHVGQNLGDNGGTTTGIDTTGADLLVLVVKYNDGALTTLSDSKSNTWTLVATYNSNGQKFISIYYAKNATVGTGHTFTATRTGAKINLGVIGFTGAHLTAPEDNHNGFGNIFVTSIQAAGAVTPSQDNCVIVSGAFAQSNPQNLSQDAAMTETDDISGVATSSEDTALAYKIQTTATAINPTWSWTTESTYGATELVAFRAAAAAAQDTPELRGRPFGLHGQAQMHQLLSQ